MLLKPRSDSALIASALVYLVTVWVLLAAIVRSNGGEFAYTLDDTYIHMAVAKNVAQHGVWGVTRYEWSNASSSPGYTALLAGAFRLVRVRRCVPLILNVVASLLFLAALNAWMVRRASGMPTWARASYLLLVVFLLPLPGLTVLGMEHVFHSLACVVMLGALVEVLDSERPSRRTTTILCVSGAAAVLLRYETLFLAAPMLAGLLDRRKWSVAGWLALSVGAPVAVLAVMSCSHGGMAIPNSLLIKGMRQEFSGHMSLTGMLSRLPGRLSWSLRMESGMAVLAFSMLAYLAVTARSRTSALWIAAAVVLFAELEHLCLIPVGANYRYSAYLVALCAAVFAPVCASMLAGSPTDGRSIRWVRAVSCAALVFLAAYSFKGRVASGLTGVPEAASNIHDQQCQMAGFLARYCRGEAVAANDVGAINYFADIRCVDVIGLGNNRIARLRYNGSLTAEAVHAILRSRGVTVAVIYDRWFRRPLRPASWVRVCNWTIPRNWVCGGSTVTFFAANPRRAEKLKRQLRRFANELPRSVTVDYY